MPQKSLSKLGVHMIGDDCSFEILHLNAYMKLWVTLFIKCCIKKLYACIYPICMNSSNVYISLMQCTSISKMWLTYEPLANVGKLFIIKVHSFKHFFHKENSFFKNIMEDDMHSNQVYSVENCPPLKILNRSIICIDYICIVTHIYICICIYYIHMHIYTYFSQ